MKLDDDLLWLDLKVRVVWGTDDPNLFYGYCTDIGNYAIPMQAEYVTDRAPVDPQDLPAMPIYDDEEEEQMQQGYDDGREKQMGGKKRKRHDPKPVSDKEKKRIIEDMLQRLGRDTVERARARLKQTHPELF